jgi:hypothetical protein
MTYEKNRDWREKKIRKVLKGTDTVAKHRKSIYNMLSDEEDDSELDNLGSEVNIMVDDDYDETYIKRR